MGIFKSSRIPDGNNDLISTIVHKSASAFRSDGYDVDATISSNGRYLGTRSAMNIILYPHNDDNALEIAERIVYAPKSRGQKLRSK